MPATTIRLGRTAAARRTRNVASGPAWEIPVSASKNGARHSKKAAAPLASWSDHDLLAEAKTEAKDRTFAELYRRHKSEIYTFCLRMMGDPDRASDLFQDVFIRAFERAS